MMTNQEMQKTQLEKLARKGKLDPALADLVARGAVSPAEALKRHLAGLQPTFDLVIAYRKLGKSSTSRQGDPVLWWKVPGKEKEVPRGKMTLAGLVASGTLDPYVLVGTEVQEAMVVNRYIKKERADAPERAARFAGATHRSTLDPDEFYQDTRGGAGTLSARWTGDGMTGWAGTGWAHPPEWARVL